MKVVVAQQDSFNNEDEKRRKKAPKPPKEKKPRRQGRGFRRTSPALSAEEVERETQQAEQEVHEAEQAITASGEGSAEEQAPIIPSDGLPDVPPNFVPPGYSVEKSIPVEEGVPTGVTSTEEEGKLEPNEGDASTAEGQEEPVAEGEPEEEEQLPKRRGLHLGKKGKKTKEEEPPEEELEAEPKGDPEEEEDLPKKGKKVKKAKKEKKPKKVKNPRKAKADAIFDEDEGEPFDGEAEEDLEFEAPRHGKGVTTWLAIAEAVVAAAIFAVLGNQVGTIILNNMVTTALGG